MSYIQKQLEKEAKEKARKDFYDALKDVANNEATHLQVSNENYNINKNYHGLHHHIQELFNCYWIANKAKYIERAEKEFYDAVEKMKEYQNLDMSTHEENRH